MSKDIETLIFEKLELISDKIEKTEGRLGNIDITLAEQAKDIKYHIKRTDLSEERLERLENEVKPVKDHVTRVEGIVKFLSILATVIGISVAVSKLF